jgi:hypothetical protein
VGKVKLIEIRKKEIILLPELNIKQKKKEISEKLKQKKSEIKEKMDLHREINNLIYQWKSIMAHTKTANELDQTFTLTHIKKDEKYGKIEMI